MQNIQPFVLLLLVLLLGSPAAPKQNLTSLKPIYSNGHWGYADASGKIAIEARFDAALPFGGGLARVGVVDEELPDIDGRPNLLWGYIDEKGRVLVELHYNVLRDFSEGLAAVAVLKSVKSRNNLQWGYIDREGQVVIPVQFRNAGDFVEGLAPVNVGGQKDSLCDADGNYGYIDKKGVFIIKPQFAMASGFKNGRAGVSLGQVEYVGRCLCCAPRFVGRHGHIGKSGEFVVDRKTEGSDSLVNLDEPGQPK